jgi:hypothetical protein
MRARAAAALAASALAGMALSACGNKTVATKTVTVTTAAGPVVASKTTSLFAATLSTDQRQDTLSLHEVRASRKQESETAQQRGPHSGLSVVGASDRSDRREHAVV